MTDHQTTSSNAALLILEDGRTFRGRSYGAQGTALGEAVFATGMTGYQETITDPSYARQLVVQTAPHIGNTGVNREDAESRRIWVAGYIVRDAARRPSNWRSERSLDEELIEQGIIGIQGVDTRAITRHLRERGAMKAGIFSGQEAARPMPELLAEVNGQASMEGARLAEEVSIDRKALSAGWFMTPNILVKGEYVQQNYNDFPSADIRNGGTFDGFVVEGVIAF